MVNEKLFQEEDLDKYCHWNKEKVKGQIKSIVLEFQGLNRYLMLDQPSPLELELGERQVLYVIPYTAPWSWMNQSAVLYTNLLLESIFEALYLPVSTPIVSTGYSMGGQAALMYTIFSRRKISACYANSPVCDLVSHWGEREDLPRTLANAFINSPVGIENELKAHSPLFQVERFPDIPYMIVAGEADEQVDKKAHSDRFVEQMQAAGRDIRYCQLKDMKHWQISDYGIYRDYVDFICGQV